MFIITTMGSCYHKHLSQALCVLISQLAQPAWEYSHTVNTHLVGGTDQVTPTEVLV
jgi:hypothetical protein